MSCDAAVLLNSHELLSLIEKTEQNIAKLYNKERARLLELANRKRNWFASLFMASEWYTIVCIDRSFQSKMSRLWKMHEMCSHGNQVSISLEMFTWLSDNQKEEIGW